MGEKKVRWVGVTLDELKDAIRDVMREEYVDRCVFGDGRMSESDVMYCLGAQKATLRYWEEEGWLVPERDAEGVATYDPVAVKAMLNEIKEGDE